MENHYSILEIGPSASIDEVKSAYRRLAREAHPDHRGSAERFRVIQAAYELLSHAEKRAQYDAERRVWMAQIGAVECAKCGHANRIMRRLQPDVTARCWHCKTQLRLSLGDVVQAQRQALVHETARVLDAVGGDLAELAVDAVRSGLGRLRARLGLGRTEGNKT